MKKRKIKKPRNNLKLQKLQDKQLLRSKDSKNTIWENY